jgi:hypothetical protein
MGRNMMQAPVNLVPLVNAFMPFVAVMTVFFTGMLGLRWLARSPIAEAFAERIRVRTRQRWGLAGSREDADRIAALEGQLAHLEEQLARITDLEGQIAELAERADFAERLLAQRRDPARLAPPQP